MSYDEEFDVLEIFFQEPVPVLTVELDEDVYAHVVPQEKRVIGMTIHRFRARHAHYLLPFRGSIYPSTPEFEERLARAIVPA